MCVSTVIDWCVCYEIILSRYLCKFFIYEYILFDLTIILRIVAQTHSLLIYESLRKMWKLSPIILEMKKADVKNCKNFEN